MEDGGNILKKVLLRVKTKPFKAAIKAFNHKYLIQSIIGGASMRDDIVIATPKSTPDKIRLKKMKEGDLPRMLKFSVGRGIRTAYNPMYDINGNPIYIDGKQVYQERDSKTDVYETIVKEIYKLAFGRLEDNPQDVQLFGSFVGVIELMHKYLNKKQIERTKQRYEQKLWAPGVQSIERGDPKGDYAVKIAGYNYFLKEFHLKPNTKYIDAYYKKFPDKDKNESMIRQAIWRVL